MNLKQQTLQATDFTSHRLKNDPKYLALTIHHMNQTKIAQRLMKKLTKLGTSLPFAPLPGGRVEDVDCGTALPEVDDLDVGVGVVVRLDNGVLIESDTDVLVGRLVVELSSSVLVFVLLVRVWLVGGMVMKVVLRVWW